MKRYKYVIQLFLLKIVAMIKNLSILFIGIFLLTACDDGDIIVTTFDYDNETDLRTCSGDLDPNSDNQTAIIYNINNETYETIALAFTRNGFDGTFVRISDEDSNIVQDSTVTINLSTTNRIIYRTYNNQIPNDYFCQSIPPSSPQVNQEYISADGGYVEFITTIIEQDDNDGVPTEANAEDNYNGPYETTDPLDENYDTDGDGIPNFLDTDDDNDNVLTRNELNAEDLQTPVDPITGLADTDQDGIPNYLDEDDDGDGTLTRNDDLNARDELNEDGEPFLNPQDDVNENDLPNFLNPNISESIDPPLEELRDNDISRRFRTIVIARNITLNSTNSDEQITLETLELGRFEVSINQTLKVVLE